jgi:LmbE family N-acetylglucosaminyl deacetylase
MISVDPSTVFRGVVAITIPHMDDEVLACGGTIARLPDKSRIHAIYATDGSRSPAPLLPWRDTVTTDLRAVRMREAKRAMRHLGLPEGNVHFLGLPDGRLKRLGDDLESALEEIFRSIRPAHVLTPFRYDRHPDHIALNHSTTRLCVRDSIELTEYFVYYRWRLLPLGDVRAYIDPSRLYSVNIDSVSEQKRAALDFFESQTTVFFPWQTRPNLTPSLLDDVSRSPEVFLRYDQAASGAKVFARLAPWIRVAHRLEPALKKRKDQVVELLKRGARAS